MKSGKKYRQWKLKDYRDKNGIKMPSSNCVVCGYKKSRFVKDQEASTIWRDQLSANLPTPLALIL